MLLSSHCKLMPRTPQQHSSLASQITWRTNKPFPESLISARKHLCLLYMKEESLDCTFYSLLLSSKAKNKEIFDSTELLPPLHISSCEQYFLLP